MSLLTLFKRKENLNDEVIDELTMLRGEVRTFKIKLTKLEAEVLDIATAQDIIRNKVLRKIQNKKTDEEETDSWAGIPAVG